MAVSITTLSIMGLLATFCIQTKLIVSVAFFIVMTSVIMPSITRLSIIMPSDVMLSVVMPSVAMLNVVAPFQTPLKYEVFVIFAVLMRYKSNRVLSELILLFSFRQVFNVLGHALKLFSRFKTCIKGNKDMSYMDLRHVLQVYKICITGI